MTFVRGNSSEDDLPLEELRTDAAHRERVQELIDRPANPAPFPDNLPARPLKSKPFKWWITTGVLTFLLLGFAVATSVLSVKLVQQNNAAPTPMVTPESVTITSHPTPPATTTTLHHTTTATKAVVEVCNKDLPNQDWFISQYYCVIIDCNDVVQPEIQHDDCESFCRKQTFCSNKPGFMSLRMTECCSRCRC